MKILLISDNYNYGEKNCIWHKNLITELKNKYNDFKAYFLKEDDLKPCIGCFKCWLKTPGLCIQKDLSTNISKDFINCDLVILVTEMKFGCYSTTIKKFLDRNIPTILPFFKIVKGKMHHCARYHKYPDIITLGYGNNITYEEENTFTQLIAANAINFQKYKSKTYIIKNEDEINSIVNNMISYISNL